MTDDCDHIAIQTPEDVLAWLECIAERSGDYYTAQEAARLGAALRKRLEDDTDA